MSAKKQLTDEQKFYQQAKAYAACSIANIREMVNAMEHAAECKGEMECQTCEGSGKNPDYLEQDESLCTCDNRSWVGVDHDTACELEGPREKECNTCGGDGEVPCTEGKDSDEPEAWHDEERARERIEEDALSLQVRGDWHTPGDEDANAPTEYEILITTGGPAARIVGDLDRGQPTRARFEYQDWFKPWTEVILDSADYAVLLQYAQVFYFGD